MKATGKADKSAVGAMNRPLQLLEGCYYTFVSQLKMPVHNGVSSDRLLTKASLPCYNVADNCLMIGPEGGCLGFLAHRRTENDSTNGTTIC